MKELWIKEVNGFVVDALYDYSPGIEKAGYKQVAVDQDVIPANINSGYYMYDAESQEFLLDEDKLFVDFDAYKAAAETNKGASTVDLDIMDSQAAIFEAVTEIKNLMANKA